MNKYLIVISILFISHLASANETDSISIMKIEPFKLSFDYVESLSNRADFFYNAGNIEKTIGIGEEKVAILRRIYGEDNVEYALSLSELAFYTYNKGEYKKAVEQANKAVMILENKDMGESVLYAIIAYQLSLFLEQINESSTALNYRQNASKILNRSIGKEYNNGKNWNILSNVYSKYPKTIEANLYRKAYNEFVVMQYDSIQYAINQFWEVVYPSSERGEYIKANKLLIEPLRIFHKWGGDFYDKYISCLLLLSINYADAGNYDECYRICEKHTELIRKYCGEISSEYAKSISNYAFSLYKEGDFVKAIDKEQKALDISISVNDNLQYAMSLSNMGIYHNRIGSYEKAIAYDKEALPILEAHNQSQAYINTLSDLSDLYCKIGEYEKALFWAKRILSLVDYQSKDYYNHLSTLANCYYYLKEFDKSIDLLEEECKFIELSKLDSLLSSSSLYKNLALSYFKVGRLRDAIWNQERAIEIQRKWIGKDNIEVANDLSFLGHLYVTLGDKEKGIKLEECAGEIIRDIEGENCKDYVNCLRYLSHAYYNNIEKKLELLEKAKSIVEKDYIGGITNYIDVNGELASSYATMGKIDKVKEIENNISNNKLVQDLFMKDKDICAHYRHTLSNCYSLLGDYIKSNEIEENVLNYLQDKYGDDMSKYNHVIFNMVNNYVALNDKTNLLKILKETNIIDYYKNDIISNYTTLSYKLRNDYWTYLQKPFIDAIPLLASVTKDDYLISCAYNISALFAKNLLLKTDVSMSEIINRQDDNQLKKDYKTYLTNRMNLGLVNDKNEEDSLINIINNQEDVIRQKIHNLGVIENNDCSWKEIQSKMNRDDIAIEFLCFDSGGYDQLITALMLKKEYESPKLINICSVEVINNFYKSNQLDSLYFSIWGQIEEELEGVNNIYFSPSGPIYNLPIEYLRNNEGDYMSEKYNIFRVSSTNIIINKRTKNTYNSSVLFGDLDYDCETSNARDNNKGDRYSVDRGLRDYINKRNGFDKLLNTGDEIAEISKLLSQSNINCISYTGIDGTEDTFKKLSGQSLDIIHMSTHGMFIETNKANEQKVSYNFIFVKDDYSPIQYENAALSRSFLVMSGGNMLSKHKTIPDGMEDGILTAQEISGMNFEGLDLVVLSACQTALGDISNEGVYGLQRGFKKAGANTILMSLDKVDDEATKILMVEFYKNLMSGKTKHQSLKDAQKHLRQIDNGKFDKPEYWASFIMLDGIN